MQKIDLYFCVFLILILFMALSSCQVSETTDEHLPGDWTYIMVDNSRQQWGDFDEPGWMRYFGLDMADVTGDGYLDIVSGRYFYRNPGGDMTGEWERIDLGLNVDGSLFIDVESNGRPGIIGMAHPNIYWLKPVDQQGDSWNVVKIASTIEPTGHVTGQGYAAADLLQNGKPEILLTTGDGIYYLEIPEDPTAGEWPSKRIAPLANEQAVAVGDINRNGLLDIIGGIYVEGERLVPGTGSSYWRNSRVAWWKNPGDGSADWERHIIGVATNGDRHALADLNGNGRLDIVVTEERWGPGDQPNAHLFWFEQPEDPTHSVWDRHRITTRYSLNNLSIADMNKNDHYDIITAEHKGPHLRVSIFENDGKGNFREHLVDKGKESHLGGRVADMNGNGVLDILSIGWDEPRFLHLWRNDRMDEVD